jgi:hypothetical protein
VSAVYARSIADRIPLQHDDHPKDSPAPLEKAMCVKLFIMTWFSGLSSRGRYPLGDVIVKEKNMSWTVERNDTKQIQFTFG